MSIHLHCMMKYVLRYNFPGQLKPDKKQIPVIRKRQYVLAYLIFCRDIRKRKYVLAYLSFCRDIRKRKYVLAYLSFWSPETEISGKENMF